MIGNQLTKWLSHVVAWLTYSISIYVNYDSEETGLSRLFPVMAAIGGFQLLDLIITELKSHMTCQKFKVSHWWKFHLSKKILCKICSPV